MDRDTVLRFFHQSGALLSGHFILSSGRHSDKYLQCALVQQYPERLESLCRGLAELWKGRTVDVVIGPALGGVVLAYELARQVKARSIFMERVGERLELRRGFVLGPTDRVLVAEDVVTTGKSVKEVLEYLRITGCTILGVASLVCRDPSVDFGVPYEPLVTVEIPSFDPAECPLCREGSPAVKPGSK